MNGLVLSGGGGRGAYQVGVIKALEEGGIEPEIIVGTSIGAVNGALLASGLKAADLERVWLSLTTRQIHKLRPDFWRIHQWPSIFTTAPLEDTLNRLVDFVAVARSPRRLVVTATDVESGRLRVFHNGEVNARHIVASCSIPVIYPATRIRGRHYWDGAVLAETPLGQAIDAGADEIYVVLLSPMGARSLPHPRGLLKGAELAFELALMSSFENDLSQLERVNQLVLAGLDSKHRHVRPHVLAPSEYLSLDLILRYERPHIERLIALGYADTHRALDAGL